jgi:hypothetical protein
MNLKEIMSISGKPGLYKNVAQSKTGLIVESLLDGKRFQAFSSDKISALEEISIYTSEEDLPLREVFRRIQEKFNDQPILEVKSSDKEMIAFFESVIPDYDKERFYISHMRKVAGWYNLLLQHGVTDFSEPVEETPTETEQSPGETSGEEEKA